MTTDARPSPPGTSLADHIAELLAEDESAATVALFINLCRHSPALCTWLRTDFVHSEKTRAEFARLLAARTPVTDPERLLAVLSGEAGAYQRTAAKLRQAVSEHITEKDHGGLTAREIHRLIAHYQAGRADAGAFLLVHAWRRHVTQHDGEAPRLIRASCAFLEEVLGRGRSEQLRHLAKSIRFFSDRRVGQIGRADYGPADWWKLSLLLYLLNNPKPRYRTGEFCAHLARQRLRVNAKDIRVFCKKHGIRRDTRAGRPRRPSV